MPELGTAAWLPNELTDAVIDHLDFGSLLNAALVARSWRTRARVRLFGRLEVWSGGSRTCQRSRLPRGLAARMPCTVFLELLDRDASIFEYVRELHVVFSGGRLDSDARLDGDTMLEVLLRLPFREIEHLGFYSFPNNLHPAFGALLRSSTTLLSLHLVDLQFIDAVLLIASLKYAPNIRTIALLGGACFREEDIQVTAFAAHMQSHVASYTFTKSSQVFLAPDRLAHLLAWILHAPRLQRCLNVVGLRSFTWGSALDEFVRSHATVELEGIMSSVHSLELIIDYEDKLLRLVRMLHAFQHVPILQLTFESCAANLELAVRLLQRTDLDWSHLECVVLTPRLFNSVIPAEWSLLDELLDTAHFVSLRSVVIHLKGAFPAETAADIVRHFPRLQTRSILRVMRRPISLYTLLLLHENSARRCSSDSLEAKYPARHATGTSNCQIRDLRCNAAANRIIQLTNHHATLAMDTDSVLSILLSGCPDLVYVRDQVIPRLSECEDETEMFQLLIDAPELSGKEGVWASTFYVGPHVSPLINPAAPWEFKFGQGDAAIVLPSLL